MTEQLLAPENLVFGATLLLMLLVLRLQDGLS